jgi:transposase
MHCWHFGKEATNSDGCLSAWYQRYLSDHECESNIYLSLVKQIKQSAFDGLLNKSKHQDGIKINKVHLEKMSQWLTDNPSLTIKQVSKLLSDNFDIIVTKSTVHRAMQRCGFSYITGRKRHYKQNPAAVKEFKKNLPA